MPQTIWARVETPPHLGNAQIDPAFFSVGLPLEKEKNEGLGKYEANERSKVDEVNGGLKKDESSENEDGEGWAKEEGAKGGSNESSNEKETSEEEDESSEIIKEESSSITIANNINTKEEKDRKEGEEKNSLDESGMMENATWLDQRILEIEAAGEVPMLTDPLPITYSLIGVG